MKPLIDCVIYTWKHRKNWTHDYTAWKDQCLESFHIQHCSFSTALNINNNNIIITSNWKALCFFQRRATAVLSATCFSFPHAGQGNTKFSDYYTFHFVCIFEKLLAPAGIVASAWLEGLHAFIIFSYHALLEAVCLTFRLLIDVACPQLYFSEITVFWKLYLFICCYWKWINFVSKIRLVSKT